MDIFLVRHGEAAASWDQSSDPGLSDVGRQQAEQVATTLLQKLSPEVKANVAIVSSPLLRAGETAAPLAKILNLTVDINDVFSEIPVQVPFAERQDWLRQFMQETWSEQSDDLKDWRDKALNRLLDIQQPTVIFTHFLVLNAIVGHLSGELKTICFWPGNGSITRLHRQGSAVVLAELGEQMESLIN